jgi:Zn-dependent peptidase ImmA (M78 family)
MTNHTVTHYVADEIEKFALLVLDRNRVSAPPVNVDEIAQAERLNFDVRPLERTSGSYFRDPDGLGHATINANDHRLRQRFTKAHELAHHLIDEAADGVRVQGMPWLRLPAAYRGRDRHWMHERFAAALLLPRVWVGSFMRDRGWQLEREVLVRSVARFFDVSQAAAEIRLTELGHIERRMR